MKLQAKGISRGDENAGAKHDEALSHPGLCLFVRRVNLALVALSGCYIPSGANGRCSHSYPFDFPLSAGFIYLDSKYMRSKASGVDPRPSPRIGATMLGLAFAMACYTRWAMAGANSDVRISLSMLALIVWWIASVILCFGVRTFRFFLFPLCFLLLIVPLPESALNSIIEFLQYQSAVAARIMFRAGGVPVTQDGIMLSIPDLDIEVARECSSIRSSLMLIVTTLVLAHLFLRSWWRKILVVAAAIALSIAKNGFRIFVIAELGTRVDPGFLTGRLHHHGGIVFFCLAVVLDCVLLLFLRRTEFRRPERRSVGN